MHSIALFAGCLVHIQIISAAIRYKKDSILYFRENKGHTRREIHLSETRVKEVSPTNQMEPYLDPVFPPAPFLVGGNEPRLLCVYSFPPAELLHV